MTAYTVEERAAIWAALGNAARTGRISGESYGRAAEMFAHGAYLDAVLVMMPEGWGCEHLEWDAVSARCSLRDLSSTKVTDLRWAATPALALLAAIEAAYEASPS